MVVSMAVGLRAAALGTSATPDQGGAMSLASADRELGGVHPARAGLATGLLKRTTKRTKPKFSHRPSERPLRFFIESPSHDTLRMQRPDHSVRVRCRFRGASRGAAVPSACRNGGLLRCHGDSQRGGYGRYSTAALLRSCSMLRRLSRADGSRLRWWAPCSGLCATEPDQRSLPRDQEHNHAGSDEVGGKGSPLRAAASPCLLQLLTSPRIRCTSRPDSLHRPGALLLQWRGQAAQVTSLEVHPRPSTEGRLEL
jgi:hypothetical protein